MEENMNLKIKFYNNHFTKKIDNKKGMNIYNQNGQEYLIVERDYIYDLKLSDSLKDDYTSKVISDGNHQCSFIVDFNGIDNFIASKSLIFNDYDVRELVIKHLNLVEGKFKRFGASGSRPSEKHPGGEVVELQTIDVKNKTGCAGSVSGYLDMSNNEYSKAISLSEDGLTLREERTVYSHTIWIPENSKPIIVRVQSNIKGLSLLSVILEECKKMKIHACGISVAIDGMKTWPGTDYIITAADFAELEGKKADKVIIEVSSMEDMERYKEFLSDDLYIQLSENKIGMIMKKNATKSNGIIFLAQSYGINIDDVICFGDDYNDIDMLTLCGTGICMANGVQKAKDAADVLCDTNENDGVAKWIKENILSNQQ